MHAGEHKRLGGDNEGRSTRESILVTSHKVILMS